MLLSGGPLLEELKDKVQSENLQDKVKILGRIHPQELYKYTNIADCGINLLDEINLSKKFTTATKIFKQFQAGILTKNGIINLCDNIIKMSELSNVEKYKTNSLKAPKFYYWEIQESILFKLFD